MGHQIRGGVFQGWDVHGRRPADARGEVGAGDDDRLALAAHRLVGAYRRAGLDVLCVDLDPQGNLSDYFDVPPDASPTVADVLGGQARAAEAVHDDVLPANLGLAEAELVLGGKMGRELTLKRGLRELKRDYDLVIVDFPPSLGLLTVNAVVAADYALLSTEAQYF